MSHPGKTDVAITGIAGRFPGAPDPEALWALVRDGVDGIHRYADDELRALGASSALLADPDFVRAYGRLTDVDCFDAALFGYSPREAEIMDPQQRVFLECALAALEDCGHDPTRRDLLVGVWASAGMNMYLLFNLLPHEALISAAGDFRIMLNNDKDTLATRVSHALGLEGPSMNVQTACSSSLVAVHLACQSLLTHECDLALAGGVAIKGPQRLGYRFEGAGITAPDGICRPFDASATGTVVGDGVGVVALRRYADAVADGSSILAVIRGTAINNDGADKISFTAPRVGGQHAVIRAALELAGVSAESIGYVETHGTGTRLGDPVEVEALRRAFREDGTRRGYCRLGSVKANVGHLDTAAGVAGLVVATQALRHRCRPGLLRLERPNPELPLADGPFELAATSEPWPDGPTPRRAGVSSFGIGGTNAHVVLEEAAARAPGTERPGVQRLLLLSAHDPEALRRRARDLADHLERTPGLDVGDVAYTLHRGRRAMARRGFVVAASAEEAIAELRRLASDQAPGRTAPDRPPRVLMAFPGQGTQVSGMGQALYHQLPVFREQLDRCAALAAERLDVDLRDLLFRPEHAARLDDTAYTQPVLFAVEVALAAQLLAMGLAPAALLGHSVGAYAAACVAGVWTLEEALPLVIERGRLVARTAPGAMSSIPLAPERALAHASGLAVELAAINAPDQTVLSGTPEAIAELAKRLEAVGIRAIRLRGSRAFHSALMDPVLDELATALDRTSPRPPTWPLLSDHRGDWHAADRPPDRGHFVDHLRAPVRFAEALARGRERTDVVLEVGPGHVLSTLALLAGADDASVVAALPDPSAPRPGLLAALGRLFELGANLEVDGLFRGERRLLLRLPSYPFARQRFWIEPGRPLGNPARVDPGTCVAPPASPAHQPRYPRPALEIAYVAPRDELEAELAELWQGLLGLEAVGIHDDLLALGASSLLATQFVGLVRRRYGVDLPLRLFFEAPRVEALALELLARLAAAAGTEAVTAALHEVQQAPGADAPPTPPATPHTTPPTTPQIELVDRPEPRPPSDARPPLALSVFFFSDECSASPAERYRLVQDAARLADARGLQAVWTPERHFHPFGGLYPAPDVLAAALAAQTRRVALRAGSVVLPLHHPVRVAEAWSVVDNLSGGRVGLSVASGWQPDDFVLDPSPYDRRRESLYERLDQLQRLWRGETVAFADAAGKPVPTRLYPPPVQPELPIWVTSSRHRETWLHAAAVGANVLTGLLEQDRNALAAHVHAYRQALVSAGRDAGGHQVTLMLHTYVGRDDDDARAVAVPPLRAYLASHMGLYERFVRSADLGVDVDAMSQADRDVLIDHGVERYLGQSSLIGGPERCRRTLQALRSLGVDEVACLVDFGVGREDALRSLERVCELAAELDRAHPHEKDAP